ncbi:MAG: energy transducer TonB [Gammaproteobacteria bacterium]|nr:energy transducer TonB [Gammaproteobacteria bacterium]
MQYLIATADRSLDEGGVGQVVDFVRIKPEENIERKKPKPEKPPQPAQPPPEPPPPSMDDINPETQAMAVSGAPIQTNINLDASGFGLAPSDGEYLPIVKVEPIYPRRALSRGIEGYVIVEFTVTKLGTTKDIRIVEGQPPGMFDSAALQAAAKFKYKPRVVDGQPIEVPGVRNKITFKIEDN